MVAVVITLHAFVDYQAAQAQAFEEVVGQPLHRANFMGGVREKLDNTRTVRSQQGKLIQIPSRDVERAMETVFLEYPKRVKPRTGAMRFVERLTLKGVEVVLASAVGCDRPQGTYVDEQFLWDYVRHYGLQIADVLCSKNELELVEFCADYGHVVIDNRLARLEACAKRSPSRLCVWMCAPPGTTGCAQVPKVEPSSPRIAKALGYDNLPHSVLDLAA